MTSGGKYTRDGLPKRTSVDFDTPNRTATFYGPLGLQAADPTIPTTFEAVPAVERTNLVRPATTPIEGEPVPDFEEMADQIRAKYEFAIDFDHRTIDALADTRSFLVAARRWPVEFSALSKARV